MHVVFDILVVDLVVYDMQGWYGCVLFVVPLKFMTSGSVFCNNMYEHVFGMYGREFYLFIFTLKEYRLQ